MNKLLMTVAALTILAAPAHAFDIKFKGGAGAGAAIGGTANFSGAAGFAGSANFGGANALANNQNYGMSESTFESGYDTGAQNGNSHTYKSPSFRLQGGTIAASGSLSEANVSSVGNGFGAAAAGGVGFGGGLSAGFGGVASVK